MAFSNTEFINSEILQLLKGRGFVSSLQVFLVEIFDQIPAYAKSPGNSGNSHPMKQIQGKSRKLAGMPRFTLYKRQLRPPQSSTVVTTDSPHFQTQKCGTAANGNHTNPSNFGAFSSNGSFTEAFWTSFQAPCAWRANMGRVQARRGSHLPVHRPGPGYPPARRRHGPEKDAGGGVVRGKRGRCRPGLSFRNPVRPPRNPSLPSVLRSSRKR